MKVPNLFNAILFTSIKLLVLSLLIYYTSFFVGLLYYFIIEYLYNIFIYSIFKLEKISVNDRMFINPSNYSEFDYNVQAVCIIEQLNSELVKEKIIERIFEKFPKICSKIVYFMGDYFWDIVNYSKLSKKQRLEMYEKQIKILEIEENQTQKFIDSLLNNHLDIFIDHYLTFYLIKYKNSNKGLIITNFNHILFDGLGYINFFSFIDDDFDITKLPEIIRKKKTVKIYLQMIINYILAIIIGPYKIYKTLKEINYKEKKIFLINEKTKLKTQINTINHLHVVSSKPKSVDLMKVKNYCKKVGMTLNEFCICNVLHGFKKVMPTEEKLIIVVPIGYPNIVDKYENIKLGNNASGVINSYSLIEDFEEDKKFKGILKEIRAAVKNNVSSYTLSNIFMFLLDKFISQRFYNIIKNNARSDITLSNVPTYERHIKIGGGTITQFYPYSNSGPNKSFIAVNTYCGQLNFSLTILASIGVDPDYIIDEIIQKINRLIN